MPRAIGDKQKELAMSLVANSDGHSLAARCREAAEECAASGIAVSARTLERWCSPTPVTGGPHNSRHNRSVPQYLGDEEAHNAVKAVLAEKNGRTSVRAIAQLLPKGKTTVHSILKAEGLHGYKPIKKPSSDLHRDQKRMDFCNTMLACLDEDPEFHRRIIFTDETFIGEPRMNHQNQRTWAESQPYVWEEVSRGVGKKMAFSGMSYEFGLLPVVWCPKRMGGKEYRQILPEKIFPFLDDLTPAGFDIRFAWMQDSAACHKAISRSIYWSGNSQSLYRSGRLSFNGLQVPQN